MRLQHIAIIPDGNRRWEQKNQLPPGTGHAQAFTVCERICDWCIDNHIPYLTAFCFSTDNWKRTKQEIDQLYDLSTKCFLTRIDWYKNRGIKIIFQGRRDRFKSDFVNIMSQFEEQTKAGTQLTLYLLADYGGQEEIEWAFKNNIDLNTIRPPVDCIMRSSGEKRLSNFLTWHSAYAELVFRNEYFPEIDAKIMDEVLEEYNQRVIRKGK